MMLASLKANLAVAGLAMNRQNLGEMKLAAETRGDKLSYSLESNLGGGKITGRGESTLRAGYPTAAELHFSKLTYSGLQPARA